MNAFLIFMAQYSSIWSPAIGIEGDMEGTWLSAKFFRFAFPAILSLLYGTGPKEITQRVNSVCQEPAAMTAGLTFVVLEEQSCSPEHLLKEISQNLLLGKQTAFVVTKLWAGGSR